MLRLSKADACIVIGRQDSAANLRWAHNTVTTNGIVEEASLSIVSIILVYHRSYDAFVLMFLALHLLALRTAMAAGASSLDRLELHLGWAVIAYAFLLDQFVYALGGPDIAGAASAVFSALLYGYLLLLFCRSFAARRRGAKPGAPEAAIATE